MIQHEFITLTLAQFGQILKIPYNWSKPVCIFKWDLASLEYSRETEGPYCIDLPTPDDIRRLLELERVMVDRTIKSLKFVLPLALKQLATCSVRWPRHVIPYLMHLLIIKARFIHIQHDIDDDVDV
ncbi:hypothetical protein Tco_0455266 [Tanacetum coccineum]